MGRSPQKLRTGLSETLDTLTKDDRMTATDTPSWGTASSSLIGRAGAGDNEAWRRLVQIYGPLVYTWCRRHGLQPQDAADATQETMSAVATRIGSFDSARNGATFRGWLWTITRNKSVDLIRGKKDHVRARGGSTNLAHLNQIIEAETGSESYEASNAESERLADQKGVIGRAIALIRSNFEPTTWQAFWRTVVDGQPPDAVADELSLSRWAVYKARSRVLHRLRNELNGLEELDCESKER